MDKQRLKGTQRFYDVPVSQLDGLDELAEHLLSLLNSPSCVAKRSPTEEPALMFMKEQVARVNGLKIAIFSGEDPPPHFHVETTRGSAKFRIDNGELIEGDMDPRDERKVRYWYRQLSAKEKLIEVWNRTRPSDCVVGEFRE